MPIRQLMQEASTAHAPARSAASRLRRPFRAMAEAIRRRRGDANARRVRRVLLILIWIWMLNIFDLFYTMAALEVGGFQELNPIARLYMHSPVTLSFFKLGMLLTASLVFLAFRQRRITEVGCWGLAAVYTVLSFIWFAYYHQFIS